jgi:uncharacterized protein YjiS (DUF1127 family)
MSHDFAVNASAAQSQSGAGYIARLIDNWHARRSVTSLQDLDDHILHDMGISRADVSWAAHLPLTFNAALVLEERARMNAMR